MGDWYSEIENTVQSEKKKMTTREIRFFQVDRFLKLVFRIEANKDSCSECNGFAREVKNVVPTISGMFQGTTSSKERYEALYDGMIKHLRKTHQIFPPRYFTALYTFIGMMSGALVGLLIGWVVQRLSGQEGGQIVKNGILFGWIAGLFVGQVLGNKKDKQLLSQNRRL
jgi:hypothetical protein